LSPVETLHVDLEARGYDIVIGDGLIGRAGEWLAPVVSQPRVVVVTDDQVGPIYVERLESALGEAGVASDRITITAGEGSKDFTGYEALIGELLDLRIERGTALVALGGGVVGDLTGFAAATLLRGLDFIQVPTTLLAQVDSAVGGKTGINTRQGKNLVGAFHQPRLVLSDTAALRTLPPREWLAGYAEVVKYGLIDDAAFFDWLTENGAAAKSGDRDAVRHIVRTCCAAKARIVSADEREAGQRALLNLGHTFGHALEAEIGYGDALLHGEAVAIGLAMAFDLSVRLGLCPAEDAARVRAHLDAIGLPTTPPPRVEGWNVAALIDHMRQDKKVHGGRITFVLVRGIGRAFVARDIDLGEVEAMLAA